jgi:hypothetical protein
MAFQEPDQHPWTWTLASFGPWVERSSYHPLSTETPPAFAMPEDGQPGLMPTEQDCVPVERVLCSQGCPP